MMKISNPSSRIQPTTIEIEFASTPSSIYYTSNLHSKMKYLKQISDYPLPTTGPTSGSGNRNNGKGPVTQFPSINIPPNKVMVIADIPIAIQK